MVKLQSDERQHYRWTSYLYYIGEKQCPTWLTVSALRDYVSAPVSIDVALSEPAIDITAEASGFRPDATPLFGTQEESSSVTDL